MWVAQFDGYFSSYYWYLGHTDYYNETNHGKFMWLVTKNECDEADVGEQLDDDAKFNECKYVNMDVKCPTSTNSELAVAVRFASYKGYILELSQNSGVGGCVNFFNCSWQLRINNIRSISDSHNYTHFVKAIAVFNLAINGESIKQDNFVSDEKTIAALTYEIISSLVCSLDGLELTNDLVGKKERVKISLYNMNHHYRLLSRMTAYNIIFVICSPISFLDHEYVP